jgi:hypothetical protein
MIHVRLDAIEEIVFQSLKSNSVRAAISLHPVGFQRRFQFPLEDPYTYSKEIVSFPVDDPYEVYLRILLQCKRDSKGEFEFAEALLSLRALKLNRWARTSFRMTTLSEMAAPLLTITVEVSRLGSVPFSGNRTHWQADLIEVKSRDMTARDGRVLAKIWTRVIDEKKWPLVLRPGFSQVLKRTIAEVLRGEGEKEEIKEEEVFEIIPRKLVRERVLRKEACPLDPPEPTNDSRKRQPLLREDFYMK